MENKLDFGCFFKHSYACILIWMSIHIVLKGMCAKKKKLKEKNKFYSIHTYRGSNFGGVYHMDQVLIVKIIC